MSIAFRAIPDAERTALAERLARTGRVQIPGFFDALTAQRFLDEARERTSFQTVTTNSKGHVDLPAAWIETLTAPQKAEFGKAVQESATTRFQYLYDNYPMWDLAQAGKLTGPWAELLDFLNGEDFLAFARAFTGEERIAFADGQVTRYRRGHFLTTHDDGIEEKNRYFAYVLNLTPAWRIDWGGLLMFHSPEGHVAEAFTPAFGALNLLRVPAPHSVSQVSLFARDDRISVTGWLRGR
ncbi:MAG TPA: 2OG-Fe(II) oxygenase family protein [Caulobacteraceae bacterium]